jgi:antitoxin ParD1/3/4
MKTTQQFSITLPHDMAEAVESKIKSGAYASVSEVVRDGLRALLERDAAVERWLREEVVPGHREYLHDPSKGIPATGSSGASRRAAPRARSSKTL